MTMKLSFNTWPYASFPVWLPAYPLEEVIKRIAAIGYDGIEIGAASPHAYPPTLSTERRVNIKKILEHYGLEVSSMLPALSGGPGHNVASPIPEERRHTIEHYKEVIELCAYWGGKTVLYIPGWQIFGTSRKQAWEWSREALREISKTALDYGVTMVIEPTPFDSNLVDRCDDAIELMEEVNKPNVKLMFDTFHALHRKEVSTDYVYSMGENLHHIHISDNDRLAPGQGRGDFVSLISALKDINYDGYLAMELGFDRRDIEPDNVARQAFEYLKPLVDEANKSLLIKSK
ncbi:sugar phosphate isomerase/epimerase family protein [Peribacillus sp. B-H-3]|uniref:sugar phosphate isomerase/epimerase family protein n=1 Tax=Peribacillus sp. B-H-3 TaxID=3400420 RepID=UPI003B0223F3